MTLLLQMTTSLVMTEEAWPNLVFISLVELPSLLKVNPRYLKLSTSSSLFPFSMMFVAAV